ncbi:uncharacterized protein BDW43DRAFT_310351 [Aspergillus alliaceus]|uniref:uncharacterized protein n=1 Tax=Petromyces alliaceus TaxID=209559 RepID=UPI0012A438B1|nr:uncharacterized protein BDW43DRAFT_310351 [Aspergillus alliaceus]KAB8234327.1 hypothetical protein BDW43DRAFT_310351 [Aspergillus alliaceus]
MVKVKISGGTGDVGPTIVEVIKDNLRHEAVVLIRKPTGDIFDVPSIIVDYESIDSLRLTLKENKIYTVTSALGY